MSTYTNSPTPPAFAPTPGDAMLVRDLRKDTTLLMLPRLNDELHMQLSAPVYNRIRRFYGDTLRRDPTVGELRLLDALDRYGKDAPHRIAVGELTTRDSALAETWASMMALHGSLHGVGTALHGREAVAAPPCSLIDALSLTGHCPDRTGPQPNAPLLLSSSVQEAEAVACGYGLAARVAVDDRSYTLWTRKAPLTPPPGKKGDFILYLPRVGLMHMQALVAEIAEIAHPFPYDVRAVARRSLLCTLLDMAPAVDLYADRLMGDTAAEERIPETLLCQSPAVGADGICDYLLRTPTNRVHTVTEVLKRHGISSSVCGRVTGNGTTVIRMRGNRTGQDTPVVNLPSGFLLSMSATYLYTYGEESPSEASPSVPVPPVITRLPSPRHGEDGTTPRGYTAVALTQNEGNLLRIPEAGLLLSALSVTVSRPEEAFEAAARTVAAATDATAINATGSPVGMALSVVLTVPDTASLLRGSTLASICGIYRIAARRGLPVREPRIEVDPMRELTVTVIAYGPEDPARTVTEEGNDRQWHASEEPCHKESPGFLLPVMRRSYEGCLKALSAALGRDAAARCILRPIVMDAREEEIPAPPDAEDESTLPRKETRYVLNPDSVKGFCEQMHRWLTPVFCLSEEDTRTLLSEPAVWDSLNRLMDAGYPVVALGESCKPFAERGLLPAALTDVQTLTVPRTAATVTYAFTAESSTRLLNGLLLSVSPTAESPLLRIHLPDGTVLPDGFVGRDGKMLGILNGVDTSVLPLLRRLNFENF